MNLGHNIRDNIQNYDKIGRGFGHMVAVRTDEMPVSPSVGSYNWAGATGVWFVIDSAREMVILTMVQHPMGGPPPGTMNIGTAIPQNTPVQGKKMLTQLEWNDAFQEKVYSDLMNIK